MKIVVLFFLSNSAWSHVDISETLSSIPNSTLKESIQSLSAKHTVLWPPPFKIFKDSSPSSQPDFSFLDFSFLKGRFDNTNTGNLMGCYSGYCKPNFHVLDYNNGIILETSYRINVIPLFSDLKTNSVQSQAFYSCPLDAGLQAKNGPKDLTIGVGISMKINNVISLQCRSIHLPLDTVLLSENIEGRWPFLQLGLYDQNDKILDTEDKFQELAIEQFVKRNACLVLC